MVPASEGNEANRDEAQGVGAAGSTAEAGEHGPRGPRGGKRRPVYGALEGKMPGTSSPTSVSTKLQKIAKLAQQAPDMALTTLAHHIDEAFLREAFRRTRKNGAPGVDGRTAAHYAADLDANLDGLLHRFKSGTYRAPPVRRVHIPKGERGKTRPLGIPTFEDKVLQRAVVMVLEAVYEQDFLPCSYGFRPGRSAHMALETLWHGLMDMGGGWVLELDIESFFDAVDHVHLRSFLDQRVRDGVLRRSIDKWLKAGVLDEGREVRPQDGTPQGGVISPLLANIYLHHVLDHWFVSEVQPRMKGKAQLIRYADDAVMVFQHESDARRVMAVLAKRFAKYGLRLHPDKTRLIDFRRASRVDRSGRGPGRPRGLLGNIPARPTRGQTQNISQEPHARAATDSSLVPSTTASARAASTRSAGAQSAWTLCLFRHHGQRSCPEHVRRPSRTRMALLAGPPRRPPRHAVDTLPSRARALPASRAAYRAQRSDSRSEPVDRGAGCGKSARPVPWEPREGDLPGPPDGGTAARLMGVTSLLQWGR